MGCTYGNDMFNVHIRIMYAMYIWEQCIQVQVGRLGRMPAYLQDTFQYVLKGTFVLNVIITRCCLFNRKRYHITNDSCT